jgi:hypothetical protein
MYDTCLPLEMACMNSHFEVVAMLPHHEADPNKCNAFSLLYSDHHHMYSSSSSSIDSDFIRNMVEYGVKIQAQSANNIFRHWQLDVLTLLAGNAIDDTFDVFMEGGALSQLILRTGWEHEFSAMINTLSQGQDDSRQDQRAEVWKTQLKFCLQCAAVRGRKEVIDLLLAIGAEADIECLISAAHNKKKDVFLFFLDLDLDPTTAQPLIIPITSQKDCLKYCSGLFLFITTGLNIIENQPRRRPR